MSSESDEQSLHRIALCVDVLRGAPDNDLQAILRHKDLRRDVIFSVDHAAERARQREDEEERFQSTPWVCTEPPQDCSFRHSVICKIPNAVAHRYFLPAVNAANRADAMEKRWRLVLQQMLPSIADGNIWGTGYAPRELAWYAGVDHHSLPALADGESIPTAWVPAGRATLEELANDKSLA